MNTAIWWVRRDLRLGDNQALKAAMKDAGQVIPLFILDDKLLQSDRLGEKRRKFLMAGLAELDASLRQRGSQLVLRSGDVQSILSELISNGSANVIYAEADSSPYAQQRDSRVAAHLPLSLVGSSAILPPGTVMKDDGNPYTIFTPFSRAWRAAYAPGAAPTPPPERINSPEGMAGLITAEISNGYHSHLFPPGEGAAVKRLHGFTEDADAKIYRYARERDRLDLDSTSRLSPSIHFGMLSARQAAYSAHAAIKAAEDELSHTSAETWLNELIWRDFYLHILYHYPRVLYENYRGATIRWENDPPSFQGWCDGQTGYPVVDASMRQLTATGWMHNRARMITASFLTKDLLIDWRRGEKFFMQHLLDGDPASNNGGWQWTAGTGTDAAPFFRIFNPTIQAKKFDPYGQYIRKWVPELVGVKDEHIHEPWKMSLAEQKQAGCMIGKHYPKPMIDHTLARQRALAAYST